jgi:hypothetical protein
MRNDSAVESVDQQRAEGYRVLQELAARERAEKDAAWEGLPPHLFKGTFGSGSAS